MNKRKQYHQRHVIGSSTDIDEAGDVEVETDPDNSEESASLVETTSVVNTDGPPVLSVTQYTCAGKVIYCITEADQVDLQPVPIIDKEDSVPFRAFNLGQNFQVKKVDPPSQTLNPNRKRKGVNHDGTVANESKEKVNKTTKAKNTNNTRCKDTGTKSPSTRQVKTTKKTSKPATLQTLSASEKEANAIAKEEKLKAKKRFLTCSECGKVSLCKYQHNNHVGSHTRKRQRIEANKVNLKCSECGKVSLCQYQHKNHVESHKRRKQKYRKCPNCEERFPSRKTLAVHKQGVHGRTKRTFPPKDLLSCTHCGKKWKYKSDLEKHMQSHTNTRKFKCSYCSMTFHRYINHLVHEYNIHERIKEDGQKKEQVETVSAASQTNAEEYGESTGEKMLDRKENCNKIFGMPFRIIPFKCSYCDRVFAEKNKAYSHELNVHAMEVEADKEKKQHEGGDVESKTIAIDLRMFKCSFCGKVFQHMEHYKKHVRTHTKEKPHKCKYCDLSYAQEDSLYIHEHNVHGKGKDRYYNKDMTEDTANKGEDSNKDMTEDTANRVKGKGRKRRTRFLDCTRCGNIFRSKRDLDNHVKKHEGTAGPVRDNIFCSKQNLDNHVKKHEGTASPVRDRPYTCKQCGHVSHTQSDHIRHIKIHPPGERPHQCQECEKSFVLKHSLTIHIKRIHLNLKPHKCSVCNRAFSMKYRLALHMRIHTGEKPFTCEYCKKTFRFKTVLKTHLAQHTGERPHVCDHCSKTFVKKSVLNIHLRTHTTETKIKCSYCDRAFGDKKYLDKHLKTHMAVS